MKKTMILLLAAGLTTAIQAQNNHGSNTLGLNSSSSGELNTVHADWSFASGQSNTISPQNKNSFASGWLNNVYASEAFAFGSTNTVSAINAGAFGIANTVSAPYSMAFGYSNTASGTYSFAFGNNVSAQGTNSFVFGEHISNIKHRSFLIGFDANKPALMVERGPSVGGPFVGIATADPQSRLDIRLGDRQDIFIQSEVPHTYGGFIFKHSDGTDNWRIRAYSNFSGGYGNMLGIVSAGQTKDDLWIVANKTLIGENFDFDACTDCDQFKLFVRKGIRTERVKVDVASGVWADYVFEKNYELKPLEEVEKFIVKNKHLPDVPSTKEMEKNGLDVAQTDALLLQKIEELTLYVIQLEKESKKQAIQIERITNQ
ncbi:MAG: hypothetical protein JKY48_06540 [Flavobacteriales bacterium]|nr:hypothetical protein [Flavobacteriales bacterium]